MELSRGDALSALGAAGIVPTTESPSPGTDGPAAEWDVCPTATDGGVPTAAAVALAEVLYPTEIEGIERFVETYLHGRADADGAYHAALADAVETLDDWSRAAFDRPFGALEGDERDSLLRDMGVGLEDPVPDGSAVERLDYHLVDELLFALYASPTGRELVGAERSRSHADERDPPRQGSQA